MKKYILEILLGLAFLLLIGLCVLTQLENSTLKLQNALLVTSFNSLDKKYTEEKVKVTKLSEENEKLDLINLQLMNNSFELLRINCKQASSIEELTEILREELRCKGWCH